MKKLTSLFLSICMLFSVVQMTTVAYANEYELTDESATSKTIGLADETSLLKQVGIIEDEEPIEENSDNEFPTKEEFQQKFAQVAEDSTQNVLSEESADANGDYQELYDEYVNTDIAAANKFIEEKEATYAISYYAGTSIPTYTSITGWPVRYSFENDDGSYSYSYYYDLDDHFAYINYLIDYCGWTYYDDTTASDNSYAMIFLVKSGDMLAIVADFKNNLTTIMLPTPRNVAVTSVSLDISSRTMVVGNKYTLEATVYPSNATDQSITWSSSNTSVATVSSSGVVTAKAAGSATIKAKTSNGKYANCSITVKNFVLAYYSGTTIPTFTCVTNKNPFDSSEVDGLMMHSYNLDIESHTDYEAYLVNKAGYTCINEVTADDSSYFMAVYKKGDVLVYVMADFKNRTSVVAYEVDTTVSVTSVSLNKTTAQLGVGETTSLTATVYPSDATNKNVTWSSSNTSVATVSSSGVVTAKAVGTATITVKTADGNKTATCAVTVKIDEILVTGVSLNKTSTSLFVGDTETLIANVTPEDATNKNVTWSSSNTSVASVSSSGVVTAKAAGTATITVKTADGNKTATCTVQVKPITPTIKVENKYGQAGKTVSVTFELAHNPGIALIGFNVNYDKTAMKLTTAELGNIFTTNFQYNPDSYPFMFTVYDTTDKTANGKLVTLTFEIDENCPEGEYDITIDNLEASNINEDSIDFECMNGKITVRDSIPGDVTGDGSVTRSDLLRLAKYFSGFSVEIDEAASDVTGDGRLTRNDLLRLAKYFSGFDVVLGE